MPGRRKDLCSRVPTWRRQCTRRPVHFRLLRRVVGYFPDALVDLALDLLAYAFDLIFVHDGSPYRYACCSQADTQTQGRCRRPYRRVGSAMVGVVVEHRSLRASKARAFLRSTRKLLRNQKRKTETRESRRAAMGHRRFSAAFAVGVQPPNFGSVIGRHVGTRFSGARATDVVTGACDARCTAPTLRVYASGANRGRGPRYVRGAVRTRRRISSPLERLVQARNRQASV
ncbi:hypothetical protein B0G84_8609 [Paraburkholderia sp. BL8N3]|nr:hypothetical protein B0G84_8609 [Paraburkholderia sp. BL8N3]